MEVETDGDTPIGFSFSLNDIAEEVLHIRRVIFFVLIVTADHGWR